MNAIKEKERIIEFIRNYYKENHLKGVILGISGGKDSAVVAALFKEALGIENVIGFTLPCHSKEEDKVDAKLISDFYGFRLLDFDLTSIFDAFKIELAKLGQFTKQETLNSDINLKPRLRMATLYYMAALFTEVEKGPYLVAGTSNKSELFVGYFTKGGDSVHDISVIADFTVDEVIAIGEVLNVPSKVLYKIPSDGLSDLTDEDKLGVRYADIKTYFENKELLKEETKNKITILHTKNAHKFKIPTYLKEEK